MGMDVKEFSSNNFSPIKWINETFSKSEVHAEKEAFLLSLVSKLQLFVQQMNLVLEDTGQQILSSLPRLMKDAQNLEDEALSLKIEMMDIQREVLNLQMQTGQFMSKIEHLDFLKSKLQTSKQGLQESDGWGKLLVHLDDLFERKDLVNVCDKLAILQKSLSAQEGLPGQNERENQVEDFKNRLEALASPSVVQCFSSGDIELSKKYLSMFVCMGRVTQLKHYYRTIQKTTLEQHWNEIVELSENSNSFLGDFYEFLFENYQKQWKWCVQVFGTSAIHEPLIVIVELLSTLQPSRENVILQVLKRSNDKLDALEEFSAANVHFGNLLLKEFQLTNKPSKETLISLRKSIFDFFGFLFSQYTTIEQHFAVNKVAALKLLHPIAAETIRALAIANKKILQWAKEAFSRCERITQNCAIVPLCTVLNILMKNFIENYRKACQQLAASQTIEQNWSLLQSCISLLHTIGDLNMSLDEFEKDISFKVLAVSHYIQQNEEDRFDYKITDKRDISGLEKMVSKAIEIPKNCKNASGVVLEAIHLINPICVEAHDITLASIFAPIEKQLIFVESPSSIHASNTDLPDYSFAPQEFVTEIGQYLLTLPQHLEPLLLTPTPPLKFALEICDERYAKNLPSAFVLLTLVIEEFCAMYQSKILQIKGLNFIGSKQIATDIEYIGNVLEELGLALTLQLQQMIILLRAPPDNYFQLSSGCEPRLVTAIRQMRNVISSE